MAGFFSKNIEPYDDYMTPKSAWEDIAPHIPKDKTIWEAFYGDGQSGKDLEELGFNVIHDKRDFFKHNEGDVVVSNPPFSIKRRVLARLRELGKPFILLLPIYTITMLYFQDMFANGEDKIQIIIPRKRIHFKRWSPHDTEEQPWKKKCNFDTLYVCWKINLPSDIMFLPQ